jgi:hypothetical protein
MALVGFRNTHNHTIYVNPAQVLYVSTFEEDVTIIAYAVSDAVRQAGCLACARQRRFGAAQARRDGRQVF